MINLIKWIIFYFNYMSNYIQSPTQTPQDNSYCLTVLLLKGMNDSKTINIVLPSLIECLQDNPLSLSYRRFK